MKNLLRIFFSAEGQGNIGYGDAPSDAAGEGLLNANDGLSKDLATGTIAQLGQAIGRAGDPAILTENREIPDPAGHTISIGRNNGVDNNVLVGPDLGVAVGNDTGNGYQAQWNVDGNSSDFNIHTDDGQQILIDFDAATDSLIYNASTDGGRRRLLSSAPIIPTGFGSAVQIITATLALALTRVMSLLLCDTATGNLVINMNPALFPNQEFDIKKTSADINSITLTPTTGTIQGFGAPAASYSFNLQGESVRVKTDGINFYII